MYESIAKYLGLIREADHLIERAKLEHRNDWETFLARGLSDSCLLLREIEDDATLDFAGFPPRVDALLLDLKSRGHVDRFIAIERRLLEKTALSPEVREDLLEGMRKAVDLYLELKGDAAESWREHLAYVRKEVCSAADKAGLTIARRPLIKRAYFAGGGCLIAALNLLPPVAVALPASVASWGVGTGMVIYAGKNFFDDWFRSPAPASA